MSSKKPNKLFYDSSKGIGTLGLKYTNWLLTLSFCMLNIKRIYTRVLIPFFKCEKQITIYNFSTELIYTSHILNINKLFKIKINLFGNFLTTKILRY